MERIKVMLRIRPLTAEEVDEGLVSLCDADADGVSVTVWPPDPSAMPAADSCATGTAAAAAAAAAIASTTPHRSGVDAPRTPGRRAASCAAVLKTPRTKDGG
jgi:hypothetical protein